MISVCQGCHMVMELFEGKILWENHPQTTEFSLKSEHCSAILPTCQHHFCVTSVHCIWGQDLKKWGISSYNLGMASLNWCIKSYCIKLIKSFLKKKKKRQDCTIIEWGKFYFVIFFNAWKVLWFLFCVAHSHLPFVLGSLSLIKRKSEHCQADSLCFVLVYNWEAQAIVSLT